MPTPSELVVSLESNEIHLWLINLGKEKISNSQIEKELGPDEMHRAEKMRSIVARNQFMTCRFILRQLLGLYLQCDSKRISLIANEHGKLRLKNSPENRGLVFNLSHSGDRLLLAVGVDVALGVDIEGDRIFQDIDKIADYCLTDAELQFWKTLSGEERHENFMKFWVSKEAFAKATGRGIALGLKNIELNLQQKCYTTIPECHGHSKEWQIKLWKHEQYQCALTYQGEKRSIIEFMTLPTILTMP